MFEISLKIDKNHEVWSWVKNNNLLSLGHIGTHIDVYNKSEIDENKMKTEGVVINCKNYQLNSEIGLEVIENKNIKKGDFIIFKTGIQNKYPYGSKEYLENHPELSCDLINWLLEKKVSFIGIDCAGIKRGENHIKVDKLCEENGCYVIENLDSRKLEKVLEERVNILTVWIENPILTGLATRVFILEEENGK